MGRPSPSGLMSCTSPVSGSRIAATDLPWLARLLDELDDRLGEVWRHLRDDVAAGCERLPRRRRAAAEELDALHVGLLERRDAGRGDADGILHRGRLAVLVAGAAGSDHADVGRAVGVASRCRLAQAVRGIWLIRCDQPLHDLRGLRPGERHQEEAHPVGRLGVVAHRRDDAEVAAAAALAGPEQVGVLRRVDRALLARRRSPS